MKMRRRDWLYVLRRSFLRGVLFNSKAGEVWIFMSSGHARAVKLLPCPNVEGESSLLVMW